MKKIIEKIFPLTIPFLSPNWVQRSLRAIGLKLPLRFAKRLNYTGIVDFKVNGQKIKMRSYNTPIDNLIFWYGIYGLWEKHQLKMWTSEAKIATGIIDVGANSGVYTLIANAVSGKNVPVYAVEPVGGNLVILHENLSLNRMTSKTPVCPVAIGDKDNEEVTMYVPYRGWSDTASLDKEFAARFAKPGRLREQTVRMHTMDYLFLQHTEPDEKLLVKIDVEGNELNVLKGMQGLMETTDMHFMAELLTEEVFNEFIAAMPKDWVCLAIDEKYERIYKTNVFVITASNYLFQKIDTKW